MITTPSSSAFTTTYRPFAPSSSSLISNSSPLPCLSRLVLPGRLAAAVAVGLGLGADRFQSGRGWAHQLVELGRQRRTGLDMISIRVDGHLPAPDHHVQHHLVASRVPR